MAPALCGHRSTSPPGKLARELRWKEAARSFYRAADAFHAVGDHAGEAAALRRAAQSYEGTQSWRSAGDAWLRTARANAGHRATSNPREAPPPRRGFVCLPDMATLSFSRGARGHRWRPPDGGRRGAPLRMRRVGNAEEVISATVTRARSPTNPRRTSISPLRGRKPRTTHWISVCIGGVDSRRQLWANRLPMQSRLWRGGGHHAVK